MGNILAAKVHAANIHDTKSGSEVFLKAMYKYPTIAGVCADAGYRGTFWLFVTTFLGLICDISERIKPFFEILPKRWRIERTFSWLNNYRRLSKDYEVHTYTEENYIYIAHFHTLIRRF